MNNTTQAVILAGGKSSRFVPYSAQGHKCTLSVVGKPIIIHTIEALKKAGITRLVIVDSPDQKTQRLVEHEKISGITIHFVIQKNPEGMGDALLQTEKFLGESFYVLHGHHVDFLDFVSGFQEKRNGADGILLAKEEYEVTKYGVLKIQNDKVLDLVEKPKLGEEPSHLRIVGVYLLSRKFIEILKNIPQEHYHFEKALAKFSKENTVKVLVTKNSITLKYPWDVFSVKDYLLKHTKKSISKKAQISQTADISGEVIIEEGVTIGENATIKGPCYIGKNVYIGTNALLRNGTDIEAQSTVGANLEVKNSLIGPRTTTHFGFIGDSIIGADCKIAGGICTGNVRLDRTTVSIPINTEKISTGLHSLGVMMGSGVQVGVNVSMMPGTIIGNNTLIGPSTTVMKQVPDNVRYYTKFQEVIEEKNSKKSITSYALLQKAYHVTGEKVVLFDIDYTLFDTAEFKKSNLQTYSVYQEVLDVIEKLQPIAKLGIFSEGKLELQKNKLVQTSIHSFFSDEFVHIVPTKDETLYGILDKYDEFTLFLVDDKLLVLYNAKKYKPSIFTIWVKRGIYAQKQEPIEGFLPDATTDDLRGIVELVEGMKA